MSEKLKNVKNENVTNENKEVKVTKEKKETNDRNDKKTVVSKDKLLEAGTYFGHKASAWNPNMKEFLFPQTKRGIHIINTNFTLQRLEFAYNLILKYAKNPRTTFIFVGTKKQAKSTIKENAIRTNSYYVVDRWLGGTLTNSQTIFKRVRTMEQLEQKAAKGFEGYTKKEGMLFQKELDKLHKNLDGIRNMQGIPSFMIIADPQDDEIAVKEARKKGVKVIGILDSNADPKLVDFGIPANDDSAKSITLIMTVLADAIAVARGQKALYAYQDDEKVVLPQFENDKKDRYQPRRNYNRNNDHNNNKTNYTRNNRKDNETNTSNENNEEKKGE